MNSLRPTSVCDTTPLQRLESHSSCSEPSSPTTNGGCIGPPPSQPSTGSRTVLADSTIVGIGGQINQAIREPCTPSALTNHNNNKIEVRLNGFAPNATKASEKAKMHGMHGTRSICGRIFMDLIILGCVGLPILGFHLWGEPYQRGFFCDDATLKHPYHDSTVKTWMLYLMGFAVPIAIIVMVEFFTANSNRMHGFGNLSSSRYYIWHLELPDWIVECYKKIGVLAFGIGVGQLTTDIAKYSVGRLRPHFFAVCQPIMNDGSSCEDASNAGRYIEEFTCRGLEATPRMLKQVRLSFPSGHANFAFFTMIYMAIYLHRRMRCERAKMFKHLLQFLMLMFAWYTALTRVSDYKHHWSDVLAGSAIGMLYACVAASSIW